jgi:hypothetical protein
MAILALLAMHDLCVAEVGLFRRASIVFHVQKAVRGSREQVAGLIRQNVFNRHTSPLSAAFLVLSTTAHPDASTHIDVDLQSSGCQAGEVEASRSTATQQQT